MKPGSTRRAAACLFTVGLLCAAVGARAQQPAAPGAPPPPPPAQPGASETDGIKLAFKHKTGAIQHFKASVKTDMQISPEGHAGAAGGAAIGPIPISVNATMAYTEKVAGTVGDTGSLAIKIGSLTMDTNAMGMNIAIKSANGKVQTLVNGRPAPAGAAGAEQLQGLANIEPISIRRDPKGGVTGLSGQAFAGGNFGPVGFSMVQFPDHPVKVGDSWEFTQKIQSALPPTAGGGAIQVEMKFNHTLANLVNKNGKQIAVIETTASGTVPENNSGPLRSMNQNITGTTSFDVGRGVVLTGKYATDVNAKLSLGNLAGQAPQAAPGQPQVQLPSGLKLEGITEFAVNEVPAPKPAAATKKAPAKKAPAKKR